MPVTSLLPLPLALPLLFVASFSLGSLVVGVLFSRWRGGDIRQQDLPGGSGTFRQYGLVAAVGVSLFDTLKGAAAVALALWLAPLYTWLAVFAVVLGHCYPVFFGWRGGGGIATFLGALLLAAPVLGLSFLLIGLAIIPLYKLTLQKRLKLNAVPFSAAVAAPLAALVAHQFSMVGLADLWSGALVMFVRALDMLQQMRRGQQL